MKFKITAAILMLALTLCCLGACNEKGDENAESAQSYVSLSINPSVGLIVDENNVVTEARGENEDGIVLLYEETGIEGEKLDVALKRIAELCVEYGYLDDENRTVNALVSSSTSIMTKSIESQIQAGVSAVASETGFDLTVSYDGEYSLIRRMEEFQSSNPDNEAIQNMSVQKFQLALSVSQTSGISIEAAAELNDADLIEALKNTYGTLEEFSTDAYLRAKETAFAVYDKAAASAVCGVYSEYCLKRLLTDPVAAYYGTAYQMYTAGATCLEYVSCLAELAEDVYTYPLDESVVERVTAILGSECVEQIKNDAGEVTLESVEAYADKLFKNSALGVELESVKNELTVALNDAEASIRVELGKLAERHRELINSAIAGASAAANAVESVVSAWLDDEIEAQIALSVEEMKSLLNDLKQAVDDGSLSIDSLKEFTAKLSAKADEYLRKFENELSAEEKAELDQKKTAVLDKLTSDKETLENAIAQAEQTAKEYIAEKKALLKNVTE